MVKVDLKKLILGLNDGTYNIINFELCYSGVIHSLAELFESEEFMNNISAMCDNIDLYSIEGFEKDENGEIYINVENTNFLKQLLSDNGLLMPELEIILNFINGICILPEKNSENIKQLIIDFDHQEEIFEKVANVSVVTDCTDIIEFE